LGTKWAVVDIVDGEVFGPFDNEEDAKRFLRRHDDDMYAGTEEGFGVFHKQMSPVNMEAL
jgi:hypothetical protein